MPPKTKAQIAKEHVPHPLFESFWQAYPRKVNRLDASIAFSRVNPDSDTFRLIMAAVAAQIRAGCLRAKPSGDKSYIPHAATWLNNCRWEDEVDSPATTTDFRTNYAIDTVLDILSPDDTHVGHNGTGNHNGTIATRPDDGGDH